MSAQAENPRSLLVVRLGAMGDVVHTMYAVSGLRAAFPQLRLGWVIEERWAELLCATAERYSGARTAGRPVVDFVHTVNTKKWRRAILASETRKSFKAALREIREQRYDIAADFQGAIKSALIARLAGAGSVIGMAHPREAPAHMFYTRKVATHGAHVIDQYRALAEAIAGTSLPRPTPEFPYDETAEGSLAAKLTSPTENIVVLSPGAGWAAKQWPAERYGEVARSLAEDGLRPIINFGPGEEELARAAEGASGGAATPLSCSIGELISLLRRARLFIAADTGPLHLAAALKVPVVAIFGPTDPARNGPYGTKSVVLRNPASRTSLSHTGTPDPGLLQITSGEVVHAARQLLEAAHG